MCLRLLHHWVFHCVRYGDGPIAHPVFIRFAWRGKRLRPAESKSWEVTGTGRGGPRDEHSNGGNDYFLFVWRFGEAKAGGHQRANEATAARELYEVKLESRWGNAILPDTTFLHTGTTNREWRAGNLCNENKGSAGPTRPAGEFKLDRNDCGW